MLDLGVLILSELKHLYYGNIILTAHIHAAAHENSIYFELGKFKALDCSTAL